MSYSKRVFQDSSSSSMESKLVLNNTGFTIGKAIPVRINSSGNMALVDPSVETDIDGFIGLTKDIVANAAYGTTVSTGLLENISTSANFGETLYISKIGNLTNNKPSLGIDGFVEGDFVVKVGLIIKNTTNPIYKDLLLNIQVIGQL